ncbi:hypothetical protein [Actinoplanes sp. G11-F43]|uniref:hypothetical protein n=1 Tax=Actinoplanes sp. G11-F43 TaxID=3424130 RepID=UPI003D3273A0
MTGDFPRINRFQFLEEADQADLARTADLAGVEQALRAIVELVLHDEGFMDSMSDEAQANLLVPLGMAGAMLAGGDYTPLELVAAAGTVRYCGSPHHDEFPRRLVELLHRLPR